MLVVIEVALPNRGVDWLARPQRRRVRGAHARADHVLCLSIANGRKKRSSRRSERLLPRRG